MAFSFEIIYSPKVTFKRLHGFVTFMCPVVKTSSWSRKENAEASFCFLHTPAAPGQTTCLF